MSLLLRGHVSVSGTVQPASRPVPPQKAHGMRWCDGPGDERGPCNTAYTSSSRGRSIGVTQAATEVARTSVSGAATSGMGSRDASRARSAADITMAASSGAGAGVPVRPRAASVVSIKIRKHAPRQRSSTRLLSASTRCCRRTHTPLPPRPKHIGIAPGHSRLSAIGGALITAVAVEHKRAPK